MQDFQRFLIVLGIALLFIFNVQAQRSLEFRDDYWLEKALQIAKIEDKNIFIDTYTPWCGPCKLMDIQFQDPELGEFFNENYINIKINMDSEHGAAIKTNYDVFFLPTLIIVDKHGNVKYSSDGLISSDELLSFGKHFHNEIYNPEAVVNLHEAVSEEPVAVIQELKEFDLETIKTNSSIEKSKADKPSTNNQENTAEVTPSKTDKTVEAVNSNTTFSEDLKQEERILYTQNDQKKNPDFLYNLTYLKLQLQDGTQWSAANDYLNTQKDWSTLKNMRFIYDFVRRPGTPMFDHIVKNQVDYDILFGKNNVDRSIGIMINMYLYQGYPRPTEEESLQLFTLLDPEVAEQATYNYLLERYELDEDYESYVRLALKYLDEIDPDAFEIINNVAVFHENSTANLSTNQLIKMMEHAIEVQGGTYYELYDTIAALYFKKGKKRKALDSINRAMELASSSGVEVTNIVQLRSMILEL